MIHNTRLSVVVVTFNEGYKLKRCLDALDDVCAVIVVDLGSHDDSIPIAEKRGAHVLRHAWVPVVEQMYPDIIQQVQSSWIFKVDPDEVIPGKLFTAIMECIETHDRLAMIRLPHRFYFKGKPLHTTQWGTIKSSPKVFHKERVIVQPSVHSWIRVREGYEEIKIQPAEGNTIAHYWADSYGELFRKHWRYIKYEGKSRYNCGKRFSLQTAFTESWQALKKSFVTCRGYHSGLRGVLLSLLYCWYVGMSHLSLGVHQIKMKRKRSLIENAFPKNR